MAGNTESKVKSLVANYKLDEALDVLISETQHQTQRKQNALLVLKGKLALLEEQAINGILAQPEVDRQRAEIAHRILDIADGSPLDYETSEVQTEPQALVQKTVNVPTSGASLGKYLLFGVLLVAAVLVGVFIAKFGGSQRDKAKHPTNAEQNAEIANPQEGVVAEENTTDTNLPSTAAAGDELKVDFPNYRKKFNFLDFQYDIREVIATQYSDTEVRLIIQYILTCRNNAGSCYRAIPRVYVDGNPIGPTHQKDLLGYYSSNTTITDELTFVLPANAKQYLIEFSRDGSNWKREFKILK